VTPARLLLNLLQPLLAVLLLAGAPLLERGAGPLSDRAVAAAQDRAADGLPLEGVGRERRDRAFIEPTRFVDGDDAGQPLARPSVPPDPAGRLEGGTANKRSAPLSHRACASPPTGPPLA
jgi:hypothetical protein